jgi:hypothetical protein
MNVDQLQQKLIAVARAHPPSDHVPYAFEKRIMARLAGEGIGDRLNVWTRLLWRAAAPCLGITVILSVLTLTSGGVGSREVPLSEALETTVYAALTVPGD